MIVTLFYCKTVSNKKGWWSCKYRTKYSTLIRHKFSVHGTHFYGKCAVVWITMCQKIVRMKLSTDHLTKKNVECAMCQMTLVQTTLNNSRMLFLMTCNDHSTEEMDEQRFATEGSTEWLSGREAGVVLTVRHIVMFLCDRIWPIFTSNIWLNPFSILRYFLILLTASKPFVALYLFNVNYQIF